MSLPVELLSGADAELQEIFNRFEEILITAILDLRQDPQRIHRRLQH